MPLLPVLFRRVEVVLHVAEKFDLHHMNLLDRDTRYLGPGLIRVSVVIKN